MKTKLVSFSDAEFDVLEQASQIEMRTVAGFIRKASFDKANEVITTANEAPAVITMKHAQPKDN